MTFVAGSNDHPLVDQAETLTTEIVGARLVVVDGAYHSAQLTHS